MINRRAFLTVLGSGAVLGAAAACTKASTASAPATVTVTESATPTPTTSTSPSATVTTPKPTPTPTKLGAPVSVNSVEGDGITYGVGMPIIIRFGRSPTSKAAFEKVAVVTQNGKPVDGAWYWEKPFADSPVQAHYRPKNFWAAYSKIHVGLPLKGVSAGKGLSFANDLTLDYSIGAYNYASVDSRSLVMTVYRDGKVIKRIPVSLGAGKTPTFSGTKVIMQMDNPVRMIGPGYNELVNWSCRLTNSGEYVHAAPWNSRIGQVSTSNGCTNLSTADAEWFYKNHRIGDVVEYPTTDGSPMPSWDGYGDWNLSWAQWQAGGLSLA